MIAKPLVCLTLLFSTALPVFAQNSLLQQGREALTDRRYDEATRLLSQAAAPGQERADEAQLLLGHALLQAKQYDAALAAYEKLLRDFPQSSWRKKALFKKADVFMAQKQWDKAATIYEPELDFIVSDERKEQVAEFYLKYANQYFEPAKNPKGETPAPNYAKAKTLFQKSLDIGLTPKKIEEVTLKIALCDFGAGNWNEAINTLRGLLTRFPNGAQSDEAKYHLGLANMKAANDREARKIFRDFLRDYPTAARRPDVSYALAETYHVPQPRDAKELQLGVQALRDFIQQFPAHPKTLQAGYYIGLSLFNLSRYEDAVKEFQAFITANARSTGDELAQAKNQLGLALFRQKKYDAAIAAWETFLRDHPTHPQWLAVQRQVIDAQYAIGDEAYAVKKYDVARKAWQAFQDKYPLDQRNADIMFRLGVILSEDKQYDAAIDQWKKVASKYGGMEAASRAQFMIAMTYETQNRFEEAIVAHRAVTGKWQNEAQSRVAELQNRKMLVYTEHTFTTAETPALKLVTRNVPRVQLRAYRVDMNDYFRKLHTMRGVDALDLALIEPDWRWSLEIPDYKDFRQSDAQAPLPFKEPGVYAVVCSAPLDEKKTENAPTLETTNVVLITDMGVITKITHNDVLVFAQNQRTHAPWPNTQILLTDGRKIVANGSTNNDGVFQWKNAEKADNTRPLSADVRVLAQNNGHFASTENNLGSVVRAVGFQPRALIYTDRPLYRAGHPVYFRAIVRQVENGQYAFKKGDDYQVEIADSGGATIFSKRLTLGDFGTVSGNLMLNNEAPPGRYTITVTRPREVVESDDPRIVPVADAAPRVANPRPKRQALSGNAYFAVAAYALEKVRLTIDLPKSVYLRGEEIKGTVKAKYLHGEPLAKRKIRFGWNNEIGEEKETDAKGEFEFSIPTRRFEEDESVVLWARLEEENAGVQRATFVATVGVNATLSMLRDVHLVGEKFDLAVETKDLADKAFAGDFKLAALRLEKDDAGRLSEREVQNMAVKTDASGKATASLTLAESGEYILRLTGQDGNGNPLSSDLATQIVGDEDKVRLRVLADGDSYKVGGSAALRVVWRGAEKVENQPEAPDAAAPKLALVTYEGDRIFGYQLVTLNKSEDNIVTVPLTLPMAPVFRVSIALMDGNQFHEAAKWLSVEHQLNIKIKTAQDKYRPGAKVKADIEVTDQNGKPVSAELSLAVVNQALLAAAGGASTSISVAELLQTRVAQDSLIQTQTSATFHYAAAARKIVLEVKNTESLTRTMLAGVDAGADIPRGHWAYEALNRLSQAGIIEGKPDGSYNGNQQLTRYEAAVAVARLLQNPVIAQLSSTLGRQRAANSGELQDLSGSNQIANFVTRQEGNDLVTALRKEFSTELVQLGVNTGNLENRVTALDSRVSNAPPRMTTSMGVLHRTGNFGVGAAFGGVAEGNESLVRGQNNLFKIGGRAITNLPAMRGAQGVAGAPGPQGGARQPQIAQGLLHDNDFQVFDLPEGIDALAAIDAQNGLLVRGEAQAIEMFADYGDAERSQLAAAMRRRFAETAFWNPQIVTDENGHAKAEFTLPDTLTEWRLSAAGVTKDTIAGNGESKIVSSKPFSIEIKAPATLQQGDRAQIAALVHNNSDAPVKAQVTLRAKFGATEKSLPQSVTVAANATQQINLDLDIPAVREAKISATATGGGETDTQEITLPVQAWGIERTDVEGGIAEASRSVELGLPTAKYQSYRLKINVGPSVPATLVDIAANAGGEVWRAPLTPSAAHRALALCSALGYLKAQNRAGQPIYTRLTNDLEAHVARLLKAQNADGSWGWTLPGANAKATREGDAQTTADAVLALSQAKLLGFAVPQSALGKAQEFLQARYTQAGESANTQKAMIIYALGAAGSTDFAPLNRLYRLRNTLDARGLAYFALALRSANRDPEAQEIVHLLEERVSKEALKGAATVKPAPNALNLQNTDDVALVTLAIARVAPKNLLLGDLGDWLWAHRADSGWGTPRATAWALTALGAQTFAAKIAPEKYTLGVSVNGKEIKSVSVDSDAETINLEAPADLLNGPTARVDINMAGKGKYTFSAQLIGFTDEGIVDDAARHKLEAEDKNWRGISTGPLFINRTYTQAPLLFDGKAIPRGFSTVSTDATWENYAGDVSVGRRVQVRLNWWTPNDTDLGENRGNYIVVREPLPAGCRVDEKSIHGDFERYEVADGALIFYFYNLRDPGVTYDLYGVREGAYRVLPTKIWAFERPGLYSYGTSKNLTVLARGTTGKDVYRLTPDELYHLGTAHFERAETARNGGKTPDATDLADAEKHLTELFSRDADPKGWKLRDDPARETVRMLFALSLRKNDAKNTVRFFETLRERFPQVVIGFRDIVQTARAYGAIGEREREVQVLRNTAEASFSREAQVAGALEDEGEFKASFNYVAERAREYPDVANVESALYSLAQTVAQRVEAERKAGNKDSDKELGQLAAQLLRDFLAMHAENPASDEASFAYAVNLVEQEKFDEAAAWSRRSLAHYANSPYADDLTYIATYASYLGEKFDAALQLAQELATKEYVQETGAKSRSAYRGFALYIAAQIFHARGDAARAVEFYKQVGAQFPDARESASYFLARELKIPEVTAVGPDEPAKLKITARNVKEAQISVYKVDLLKFYQNRRNLSDFSSMNLAGIKPIWEGTVDLGAAEFVDKSKIADLPLPGKGAYFVSVKADDGETRLQTSGVIVRSELQLDVQEDELSGRVRVNVARRAPEGQIAPLQPRAEVWVIGSQNQTFLKGTTDLRGVVTADNVSGVATVIAAKDGDYAFYRGTKSLQRVQSSGGGAGTVQQPNAAGKKSFQEQARDAYIDNNAIAQEKQAENYRGLQGKGATKLAPMMGVAAGQAF